MKIPGNAVLMVFRNDFAVRMLEASVAAGIEAPLRLYVTENADGSARVTYRTPSATFAPYGNRKLDVLARELDPTLKGIVADAASLSRQDQSKFSLQRRLNGKVKTAKSGLDTNNAPRSTQLLSKGPHNNVGDQTKILELAIWRTMTSL